MNAVKEKIVSIISKQIKIKPEELDLTVNPVEEYNIDSLDFVEMLIEIEDEFGINLKSTASQSISSIQDLINEVESAIDNKA